MFLLLFCSSSLIPPIAFVALLEFGSEGLGHLSGVLCHCIRCIGLSSLRCFGLVGVREFYLLGSWNPRRLVDLSGGVAFVALSPLWRSSLCGVVAFVECGSLCGFGAGCGALEPSWPCCRVWRVVAFVALYLRASGVVEFASSLILGCLPQACTGSVTTLKGPLVDRGFPFGGKARGEYGGPSGLLECLVPPHRSNGE